MVDIFRRSGPVDVREPLGLGEPQPPAVHVVAATYFDGSVALADDWSILSTVHDGTACRTLEAVDDVDIRAVRQNNRRKQST